MTIILTKLTFRRRLYKNRLQESAILYCRIIYPLKHKHYRSIPEFPVKPAKYVLKGCCVKMRPSYKASCCRTGDWEHC